MSILWLWHGSPVDVVLCVDGTNAGACWLEIWDDLLGRVPVHHRNLRYRISRNTLAQVQAMSADEELFSQRGRGAPSDLRRNLSVRAISRRLKIARKTVRKVLDGDRTIKSTVRRARVCFCPTTGPSGKS